MYLQLRPKDESNIGVLDLALSISDKTDKAMMMNNFGFGYGISMGDNVANMEFEVTDWDKALQMTLEIINNNNLLNNFIIGKRLYLS